jgi:hypothetical protein
MSHEKRAVWGPTPQPTGPYETGIGEGMPTNFYGAQRRIFISYRRSDSQPWTGRLADDLREYFGSDRIYRDLDSSRSAQDYVRQIEEALESSRVVIVVLGPQWLDSRYQDGRRRLNDSEDLVRLELERALASGIAVVPVVVGNATVPGLSDLPPSLRTLSRLQAQRLSDEDWSYDFGRLLETLESHGVVPSADATESTAFDFEQAITNTRRYERTLQASRRRAFDALLGALELLRYPRVEEDPQSAQVKFTVWGRIITAKVIDVRPGQSKVVVEFDAVRTGVAATGWLAAAAVTGGAGLLGLVGLAGLRGQQRRFAVGFLENVQRVLEGRGIGEDSALLPGVNAWRNRSREV